MNKLLFFIAVLFTSFQVEGQTTIVVRAKAKDAKFIGSSIGGAKVIIREKVTGKILAEGLTEGSTGNTDLIMREPQERYKPISDSNTAKFEANLDIQEPTFVAIEVIAPISQKQAAITASTELWIIPGKHITGDGIVIEIPGFVVDVLAPQTHESIEKPNEIAIVANVVMMCGCPLTAGGLWDANKIEVKAIIKKNGATINEIPLQITEKANTFKGAVNSPDPGLYEIIVYAFDERTGNTGVDKVNFLIR
ncbi:MAG: hypothetical protein ACNS60_01555 [Candidatus Cyclobacteriaceae bacterium M2_1C_046]